MELYFNEKQIDYLQAKQRFGVCLWGRGTGKTTAIGAKNLLRLRELPRAKGFIVGLTYGQLLTKSYPVMQDIWERAGLIEDTHYVFGKIPPAHFLKPYKPPKKYEHMLTFFNGLSIEFLSMDTPKNLRGGSYDFGDVDEAAFIAYSEISKVIIPMIRGNTDRFTSHLHQQLYFYSSVPWKPNGYWIFDYEIKADIDPEKFYFSEATAWDNVDLLTAETINNWKDTMTYLDYQVEVMNMRIKKSDCPFYVNFNENIHTGQFYDDIYDDTQPVDISLDFGGWFNGLLMIQDFHKNSYVLDVMYEKENSTVIALINRFCDKYQGHKSKLVYVWGEPRGHDKNATGDTIYVQVQREFERRGWTCKIKATGNKSASHILRYEYMAELMNGKNYKLPKLSIDEANCKDLIIAINLAELTHKGEKNKSREADRNFPQEHATHLTDQLDYYYYQKYSRPARTRSMTGNLVDFV